MATLVAMALAAGVACAATCPAAALADGVRFPRSFTTSDPARAPLVGGDFLDEGFEMPGVFPPSGWSYVPAHPSNRWQQTSVAAYVRSGTYAARILAQTASIQDEKLVSPTLDLAAASGTDLRLSFWWWTDPFWFQGTNTHFEVHVSLDGTAWTEVFSLDGFPEAGWAWRNTVVDLSSWAGVPGLLRVRFRYAGIDAADLAIDDVRVGYLASPAPPANDDCAGAATFGYVIGPAAGSWQVTGNSLLAANDYPLTMPGSCTGYTHTGRDVVWRVDLPENHRFDAVMDTIGNWDDTLFLVTDCASPAASCVAGDRGFPDGAHVSVMNPGPGPRSYWMVVSGYGTAAGEFVVTGSIFPDTAIEAASWGRTKAAYRTGDR